MNHQAKFLYVGPGAIVSCDGRTYRIDKILDHTTLLGQDVVTNEWTHLKSLRVTMPPNDGPSRPPVPDLVTHGPGYEVAQGRYQSIKPLLEAFPRTVEAVKAAAAAAGVGRATIYDWLRRYEDSPQLSSLIPGTRGVDKGGKKLDPRVEAIIEAAMVNTHRTKQLHRVRETYLEVCKMCRKAGLSSPHENSVRARVAALPRARTLRERGRRDEARDRFDPIRGRFPNADWPMSVVQVDHTPGNVELVDDEMRLPLGRPWITVALDVCTRKMVGIYVSMERPNASTTGNCIALAMLPKGEYLKRLGIDAVWDGWGEIGVLHMDNAKEFRGKVLTRACVEYGIDLQLRPVKTPHYGGHIERLMGTMAGELRKLDGTTFADPEERGTYDSQKEATMTFSEFERYIVKWFVKRYNTERHSTLDMSPNAAWDLKAATRLDGQPSGLVQGPPKDPERLRLDFMQFEYRTVGRPGIRMKGITFWDDVLKLRIEEPDPVHRKSKRKFLIRQDPRDITRIWFLDPDTQLYRCIPTRDLGRPAVSLWEWRAIRQHRKDHGKATFDEDAMFETIEELRRDRENSLAKTKAARRHHQRAKAAGKHGAAARAREAADARVVRADPAVDDEGTPGTGSDAPFIGPLEPFDDIEF